MNRIRNIRIAVGLPILLILVCQFLVFSGVTVQAADPVDPELKAKIDELESIAKSKQQEGDLAAATDAYRQIIAAIEQQKGRDHRQILDYVFRLGAIYYNASRFNAARPCFERILAICEETFGEADARTVRASANLATVLNEIGDAPAARDLFEKTLALREELYGPVSQEVGQTLVNLGIVCRGLGELDEARIYYERALSVFSETIGTQEYLYAFTLNSYGNLLSQVGQYDRGREVLTEAVAVWSALFGPEHRDVAMARHNLGNLLADAGDLVAAQTEYLEASAQFHSILGPEHEESVHCATNLGAVVWEMGHDARADSILTLATRTFEVARLRGSSGFARATFLQSPYRPLTSARLGCGKPHEAWLAAERDLGRVLVDLILATNHRSLDPDEVARQDSLSRELTLREEQAAALASAAGADTSTADTRALSRQAQVDLLQASSAWHDFQQAMAAKYPVTEGFAYPLSRIQAAIPPSTALVGWLDLQGKTQRRESWAYVIRHEGDVHWVALQIDRGALDGSEETTDPYADARTYRQAVSRPSPFADVGPRDEAHRLWRQRIEPLMPHLDDVRQLAVLPSGATLGVPVETFIDPEGRHLGDLYTVYYTPSATVHTWLAERDSIPRTGLGLLIGDPPFTGDHLVAMASEPDDRPGDAFEIALRSDRTDSDSPDDAVLRSVLSGHRESLTDLSRLANTRHEILALADLMPSSRVLIGPDASEANLVDLAESDALAAFQTIHVATHAFADDQQPENSALILSQLDLPDPLASAFSDERVYDGLITAGEIIRQWRLTADLVTLSACATGLGKEVVGEGFIGFGHAFLQAGAGSVLVSLWNVDDEATALLMSRFYENRSGRFRDHRDDRPHRPMSNAAALQEAKRWLRRYESEDGRRPFAHPFYWSAFILLGQA